MSIKKLLIANRGEIACRIMTTAHKLGYRTVAVYSDVDADALHVQLADQAIRLGPAPAGDSYLNRERILEAAQQAGADALHPGYGFLSEDAAFARQVEQAGLTWIGPPPAAMEIMGNKAAAKAASAGAGVTCLPGYQGADQDDASLVSAAATIGYPLMVKAAAGGGGRGIRRVATAVALPAALAAVRSEASTAFGSDELLLEQALINPRHVEVQIIADRAGNILHLGERDCSIQRRNQKVLEEAPGPTVSPDLRQRLGRTAVAIARAVGYISVGTVEFLLDADDQFYFIEMNTRLQVEHPVTEMITGLDLVAWQLHIAEGLPLPWQQTDVTLEGHAIEARLYAEDADQAFLPTTGTIIGWQPPTGDGVRVDHAVRKNTAVTPYYDGLVAKVSAWGETRAIARRRLQRALLDTAVLGVTNNRQFLLAALEHPTFGSGNVTTGFIQETWLAEARPSAPVSPRLAGLAALLFYLQKQADINVAMRNWRSLPATFCFGAGPDEQLLTVTAVRSDQYAVQVGAEAFIFDVLAQTEMHLRYLCDGMQETLWYAFAPDGRLWLQHENLTVTFVDTLLAPPRPGDTAASGQIVAPLPGTVRRLPVREGDQVTQGQALLVLEAMKMEHTIAAPFAGVVQQILIEEGQQMKPAELMIVVVKPVEPHDAPLS